MTVVTSDAYIFRHEGEFDGRAFKRMLKHCLDVQASDILIQSGDFVWAEIHGRQHQVTSFPMSLSRIEELIPCIWTADILGHIKRGGGADRALEISGEDIGFARGKRARFRCNFIQADVSQVTEGISITMRVIPSVIPPLDGMQLPDDLRYSLYPSSGLVLICGPTGSGKTTLLSSVYQYALQHFPDRKLLTYEDPIEFPLGGKSACGPQPSQSQIGRDIPNFAEALRNAMRRKPDIIGIGEARDMETIAAMMQAGETGHLCYATVHTESVAETFNRLIQVFPPALQPAKAIMLIGIIRMIVIQRLVKTRDGKRRAIREYLVFDREVRSQLQDMPYEQWSRAIRLKLENNAQTIEDRAWELVEEGALSNEDYISIAGYASFKAREAMRKYV